MITIKVLLVLFCGFIDRMRGDPKHIINRTFEIVLYGLAAGFIIFDTSSPVMLAAFAAFFALGSSVGWGEPLSAMLYDTRMIKERFEWWQFGVFKKNAVAACALRGFIWSAPCLPLAYWDTRSLFMLVMVPIFPLSIYITKKIKVGALWETNEIVRGLLLGVCLLCLSLAVPV